MNPVDHPHGGGNHQAVHGPSSVARGTPPGAKVATLLQAAQEEARQENLR